MAWIALASQLKRVLVFTSINRDVRFRSARRGFFRNVTLLTEKQPARCLYMSIGVINMACPR